MCSFSLLGSWIDFRRFCFLFPLGNIILFILPVNAKKSILYIQSEHLVKEDRTILIYGVDKLNYQRVTHPSSFPLSLSLYPPTPPPASLSADSPPPSSLPLSWFPPPLPSLLQPLWEAARPAKPRYFRLPSLSRSLQHICSSIQYTHCTVNICQRSVFCRLVSGERFEVEKAFKYAFTDFL
jgi:hypothetical protein